MVRPPVAGIFSLGIIGRAGRGQALPLMAHEKSTIESMELGLISDIHRHLPEAAIQALQGCDRIICAGDVEDPRLLWELESIAPTIAVLGNCDRGTLWDPMVRFSTSPTLGGVKFLIVHRPQDIGILAPEVRVVVHGHTHVPRNEVIGDVRYVNPGSCSYPRGGSRASVARMTVADGEAGNVRFIELPEK